EFWVSGKLEALARSAGLLVDGAALESSWSAIIDAVLEQATLTRPPAPEGYVSEGKVGVHSEHLSFLLAEMQSLARAHPGAQW
ncbi:MAG: Phenylacetic acid catabolic protein, partial [Betaproteobacteria bacterium]